MRRPVAVAEEAAVSAWMSGPWMHLACFGLSVVSALVPWFNGEAILLAFAATADARSELIALVLAATAGQMLGKCVLYGLARGASHAHRLADGCRVDRWRRRLEASRRAPLLLVFVSSVVGVPPFYVITLLAGGCRVGFAGFCGAGTLGRLVRFGTIVTLPRLALNAIG